MKKLLSAIAACFLTSTAYAGEFEGVNNYTVVYTGDIEHGDDDKLISTMRVRSGLGMTTTAIILNSPGGFTKPAKAMAYTIRRMGMSTAIAEYDKCASACMLMFAAGTTRYVQPHAQLGVHSATSSRSQDGARYESGDGTVDMAREMKSYGTPDTVITAMVMASPDEMHWLTGAEIEGWVDWLPPTPKDYTPTPAPTLATTPMPAPAPVPTNVDLSVMTCQSTVSGTNYIVRWYNDNTVDVGKRNFKAYSIRAGKEDPDQRVVSGRTLVKNGHFAAVFGGTSPKIFFWTNNEKVVDRCWYGQG